jgi:hypothetical protein
MTISLLLFLEALIQPCQVKLEKIASDFNHLSKNNSANAPSLGVRESNRCTSQFQDTIGLKTNFSAVPSDVGKKSNDKKSASSDATSFQCTLCQKIVTSNNDLREHMKKIHKNGIKCRSFCCAAYFLTEDERQQHENDVHLNCENSTCAKCIFCGALYTNGIKYLNKHIQRLHKEAIQCDFNDHCTKYFRTKSDKDKHILQVHENVKRKMPCIYCRMIYTNNLALIHHTKKHHESISIKCRFYGCGLYFLSHKKSDKHFQEKHQLEDIRKKFHCPNNCTFKSAKKANLLLHIKRKHTKATLKCPHRHCLKTFTAQVTLKRHVKLSHGERGTCEHCGKEMFKESLKNHFWKRICRGTK